MIDFLYSLERFGASTFVKPRYETTVDRVDHPNREELLLLESFWLFIDLQLYEMFFSPGGEEA